MCGKAQPSLGLRGEPGRDARWCAHCPDKPAYAVNTVSKKVIIYPYSSNNLLEPVLLRIQVVRLLPHRVQVIKDPILRVAPTETYRR